MNNYLELSHSNDLDLGCGEMCSSILGSFVLDIQENFTRPDPRNTPETSATCKYGLQIPSCYVWKSGVCSRVQCWMFFEHNIWGLSKDVQFVSNFETQPSHDKSLVDFMGKYICSLTKYWFAIGYRFHWVKHHVLSKHVKAISALNGFHPKNSFWRGFFLGTVRNKKTTFHNMAIFGVQPFFLPIQKLTCSFASFSWFYPE